MSEIVAINEQITPTAIVAVEAQKEAIEPINEVVPLEKVKKPRTDKQIEAFKKIQLKRSENIATKKANKTTPVSVPVSIPAPVSVPVSVPVQAKQQDPESESDSEKEIIIKRKPKKSGKPKKQIVIELSDSESESEQEQTKPSKPDIKKCKFDSQQNKKYAQKVESKNFFCD